MEYNEIIKLLKIEILILTIIDKYMNNYYNYSYINDIITHSNGNKD